MTKTVPAAEFAENVQALLDDVKRGDEVLVTENGTPVVMLVPFDVREARERAMERLRGSLKIVGDIVSPIDLDADDEK